MIKQFAMMDKIPMVNLQKQYQKLSIEIDKSIGDVLKSGQFINGEAVKAFEYQLSRYLGVKHVISCGNGTDALTAALASLNLNPGDEVITATFTFVATAEAIAVLKLTPVLVDVDLDTFTINVEEIEKAITPKTKAIIPVHLYGQGAKMASLLKLAKKHNIKVVEDAAQCLGAEYKANGKTEKLGTIGDIGCTSFFPSKPLGCYGDGGACFTNDDDLAKKIRQFVNHGSEMKYYHKSIGINSRLDAIQAAILNVKLPYLDDFNHARQKVAAHYVNAFKDIPELKLPSLNPDSTHVYHQYTMRVLNGQRDALRMFLQEKGIASMVYYPVPIHLQPAYSGIYRGRKKLPVAEQLSNALISLPIHSEMAEKELNYITVNIRRFFEK